MSPRSHSEEPGGLKDRPKNQKRSKASARAEAEHKRARYARTNNPPPDAVPLEPIFERYINRKTGEQMVVQIARSAGRNGRIYLQPMPPVFGAHIRVRAPVRRSASILPPRGKSDGKNYVWAGHLERCVDPDTGDVWYVPVVYIVEQAVHPNGRLVPK